MPLHFREVLAYLRGAYFKELEEEFKEITDARDAKRALNGKGEEDDWKTSLSLLVKTLNSRLFWKPFACVGVIFVLYGISGYGVMANYMAFFLAQSGVDLDPLLATIVIHVTRVPTAIAASFLLLRCSKKVVFFACTMVTVVSLAASEFIK